MVESSVDSDGADTFEEDSAAKLVGKRTKSAAQVRDGGKHVVSQEWIPKGKNGDFKEIV